MSQPATKLIDQVVVSFPTPDMGFNGRYYTTAGGAVNIDFYNAVITVIDTPQNPSPNGDGKWNLNARLDSVQSLLLFVSDGDVEIYIDSKPVLNDMQLWHLFEQVNIKQIQLRFPTDKVPNAYAFMFVASNRPSMGYKNSLFVCHDIKLQNTQISTDPDVVTFERHVFGYDNTILITKNTDMANGITVTVEESPDEVNFYPVTGYPKNIAAGVIDELDILIKYHYIRVKVKSQVGGSPATFDQNLQLAR